MRAEECAVHCTQTPPAFNCSVHMNQPGGHLERRRKERGWYDMWSAIALFPLGLGIGCLPIRMLFDPNGRTFLWLALGFFCLFMILRASCDVSALRHWRWKKRAAREDYLICPLCRYSLKGHGSEGRCPECGASYTLQELIQYWTDKKIDEADSVATRDHRDSEGS